MVILKNIGAEKMDGVDHWLVLGVDHDGRAYTHERDFFSYRDAGRLVRRIVANDGEIDPDHWFVRVPYGTNAWLDDGYEDATILDERYGGLGEGTELAHIW